MDKIISYNKETHLTFYNKDLKEISLTYDTPLLMIDNIELNHRINQLKNKFKDMDVIVKSNIPLYDNDCILSKLLNINFFQNAYYDSRNKSSEEILIALENKIENFIISNESELDLLNIVLNYYNPNYKINIYLKCQSSVIKNSENNRCLHFNQLQKYFVKIKENENLIFKGLYFNIDSIQEDEEKIIKELVSFNEWLSQNDVHYDEFLINVIENENIFSLIEHQSFIKNLQEVFKQQNIQLRFILEKEIKDCFYILTSIGNELNYTENGKKVSQVYFDYDFNSLDFKNSSFLPYIKPLLADHNYVLMNKNYQPEENFKQIKTDIINRGDLYLFKNIDIDNFIQYIKLYNLKNRIICFYKKSENSKEISITNID